MTSTRPCGSQHTPHHRMKTYSVRSYFRSHLSVCSIYYIPLWLCIALAFKPKWCVIPSWMLWRNLSIFSSTLLTSPTKLVIEAKKDIKFIWQGLFSINTCWWAWIIFPLLATPLFYLGSMSGWQAYNYLGRLLYLFKILARDKLSVNPVEISCCSMSYGE